LIIIINEGKNVINHYFCAVIGTARGSFIIPGDLKKSTHGPLDGLVRCQSRNRKLG